MFSNGSRYRYSINLIKTGSKYNLVGVNVVTSPTFHAKIGQGPFYLLQIKKRHFRKPYA
jgi:hypothetical protein